MGMWCVYLLVICPLTALSLEDNVHIPRSAPCTDLTLVGQPPSSGCSWCFQDKCRCMEDMADCSGNNGSLTFIPQLPAHIRRVNFSHNGLTAIEEGEFFHNVTNISLLDLSGNHLVNLSQDAFHLLTNLTHLSLINNNNLTGGYLLSPNSSELSRGMALSSVCNVSTLVELDIMTSYVHIILTVDASVRESDKDPLECLQKLSALRRLNADVILSRKPSGDFVCQLAGLSHLTHLTLTAQTNDGKSVEMDSPTFLYSPVSFETLEFNNIKLKAWSLHCVGTEYTFPNLTYLSAVSLSSAPDSNCRYPKLQTLVYMDVKVNYRSQHEFDNRTMPELTQLYLEGAHGSSSYCNNLCCEKRGYGRGNIWNTFGINPVLQTLSFKNGKITLCPIKSGPNFNASDVFGGCPNLRNLTLAGNDLSYLDDSVFLELFADLINLRYVDLNGCQIDNTTLDRTAIAFQHVETLLMAGNNVTSIPDGLVDNMTNLVDLDLHGNQISLVSETTFSAHTRGRLRSLDLSANPFLCSCQLLWFRDWLKSNPALFARSHSTYMCSNLPNTFLVNYDPQNQSCVVQYVMPRYLIVIIILTVVMATVTPVTVVLVYRYRTSIHRCCGLLVEYMHRVFHRMRKALRRRGRYVIQLRDHDLQLRKQRINGRNFRYDIFVCYAAEDMDWVRAHLLPEMEGRRGLRLCDHERDFIPGKNIVNNVVDCVESSKKVLMLFSTSFADSQWCQFELNLCLRHVMDLQDGLVIVLLAAIPPEDLTPAMKAVLYTTTYIEWEEEEVARPIFWNRLRLSMPDIMGRN